MKPTRKVSRRSFLASVAGAAVGGGALLAIAGRAGAVPAAGDSDFASPIPMGDTFQSDPPPGHRTGLTDRDGGPAADLAGYGTGRARREAHAARCRETRRRIARYQGTRPRTPEVEQRLATLRTYLERLRCS